MKQIILWVLLILTFSVTVGCASLKPNPVESLEPSLQKSLDPDQHLLLDEQFLKKSRAVGVYLPTTGDRKVRRSLRP